MAKQISAGVQSRTHAQYVHFVFGMLTHCYPQNSHTERITDLASWLQKFCSVFKILWSDR